jgi:hypothetical protein
VEVKKYTESHEWIELADDGKTGELQLLPLPRFTGTLKDCNR